MSELREMRANFAQDETKRWRTIAARRDEIYSEISHISRDHGG